MKLAFCLFHYFPYGGLQRDFLRIARECISRGHRIDVYTMNWDGPVEAGFDVHIIHSKGFQNHTQREDFVRQVSPILQNKHYDLIVGFNKMPGLHVYYAADTCYQSKARQSRSWIYRLTSRFRHSVMYEEAIFSKTSSTHILLLSEIQQIEYQTYYQTPSHRFHLLPPGIARDRIAPENSADIRNMLRQELHIKPDEFLLLMVGSGFKTKGLDRTLLAYSSLPSHLKNRTRLVVIGKDNSQPFERQAKRLGMANQLTFLGGRDDVPRFLLGADLLLHPAYNENTGTVLLEALASGLPVLTTDVCGYAHFIKEANAGVVLSSPFQQCEFNKMLENMLSSSQHSEWKQNGINFAIKTDIYSLPQQAVDFLESLKK